MQYPDKSDRQAGTVMTRELILQTRLCFNLRIAAMAVVAAVPLVWISLLLGALRGLALVER